MDTDLDGNYVNHMLVPLTEFAADLSAFADGLTNQSDNLYTRFGYHERQALAAILNKLTTIIEDR